LSNDNRLSDAHQAVHALRPVPPLGLCNGLAAIGLTLWDERRGRLVRFRDASPPEGRGVPAREERS
jgi:hypothetical protein